MQNIYFTHRGKEGKLLRSVAKVLKGLRYSAISFNVKVTDALSKREFVTVDIIYLR